MGLDDQIAYAESLVANIATELLKLGRPTGAFGAEQVHAYLHKHRVTPVLRTRWSEYTKAELSRAIAKLRMVHAQYHRKYLDQCETRAAEYEEQRRREQLIREECYTAEQAQEWMQANARSRRMIECFAYEGTVRGIAYHRLREQSLRLYTLREAMRTYDDMLAASGRTFEECFQEWTEPGCTETFYVALFVQVAAERG